MISSPRLAGNRQRPWGGPGIPLLCEPGRDLVGRPWGGLLPLYCEAPWDLRRRHWGGPGAVRSLCDARLSRVPKKSGPVVGGVLAPQVCAYSAGHLPAGAAAERRLRRARRAAPRYPAATHDRLLLQRSAPSLYRLRQVRW